MLCGLIGYPKTLFLLFFLTNYTQWIPAASVDLMCQPGIVTKPTSVRSIRKYSGMTKCFVKLDTCIVLLCVVVCVCVGVCVRVSSGGCGVGCGVGVCVLMLWCCSVSVCVCVCVCVSVCLLPSQSID